MNVNIIIILNFDKDLIFKRKIKLAKNPSQTKIVKSSKEILIGLEIDLILLNRLK